MSERQRVFRDDIGEWPEIYQTGPQSFEVIARHGTPDSELTLNKFSFIAPFVVFFLLKPYWGQDTWGFVLIALVGGGMIGYIIMRKVLNDIPILTNRTTHVFLDGGAISWGKHRVRPDMERSFRTDHHRGSIAERRRNQKNQTHVHLYETSSEVLIDSGPGMMHQRVVAEITDDERLELGHILASTLRHVDQKAREAASKAIKVQVRGGLD